MLSPHTVVLQNNLAVACLIKRMNAEVMGTSPCASDPGLRVPHVYAVHELSLPDVGIAFSMAYLQERQAGSRRPFAWNG